MVISIETHITCDFLGGGGVRTPYPALDPHMTGWQLGLHWLSPQKKQARQNAVSDILQYLR